MAASRESWISLWCFLLGSAICWIPVLELMTTALGYTLNSYGNYLIGLNVIIFNVFIKVILKNNDYKNGVRAGVLGACFGAGTLISCSTAPYFRFGWYLTSLSFFHWSEYYITAITNPRSLTLESYLLDHSREYKLAALSSWLEFTLEFYLFPGLKQLSIVSFIGLLLVVGGEILRKVSMATANTNFNHYVQHRKHQDHQLVTHGVYNYSRHPSYVGWFYWSIGTQLILCNPLCLVAYTIISWKFFKERIYEEELYLLNFFGEDYIDYQRKVSTGLPFINGYMYTV